MRAVDVLDPDELAEPGTPQKREAGPTHRPRRSRWVVAVSLIALFALLEVLGPWEPRASSVLEGPRTETGTSVGTSASPKKAGTRAEPHEDPDAPPTSPKELTTPSPGNPYGVAGG
jgi:hypothetical protein